MICGRVLAALLVVGVAGCARPTATGGGGGAPELISSLDVKVDGDSVLMTLHLTSALETPVVLEFPSAQRSDFAVRRAGGEVVWTWSMDRQFAQVTGADTLRSGETLEFSGSWTAARPGSYEAVGRLVSTNQPVEVVVPFEVQ